MRLKKIPKGKKVISFVNTNEKGCMLYLDKEPFVYVSGNSTLTITCDTFLVACPLDSFPAIQLYCGKNIFIDYF